MMRRSAGQWVGTFVGSLVVAACSADGATNDTTPSTFGAPIVSSQPSSTAASIDATDPAPIDHECVPAPGAQCALAESFAPPIVRGMDLTGIDLRGATLGEDSDLRDVDLTGASLADANLSDADLTGATLSDATLAGADVNATLFDADDLPASIPNVTVGVRSGETLSGADLSGLDLTGVQFVSRANGIAPMAGARFTGATLTGASFLRIDLTGADFTDAVFAVEGGAEPTFIETTCPDFLPSDPALAGRAACRL